MLRQTKRQGLAFISAIVFNCFAGIQSAHADKCEMPQSLRFSMIPAGDFERDIKLFQPLIKRIETLTKRPIAVIRPSSYAAVIEGLQSGDIDIAMLGPATYVEARNGDPLLTPFATIEKRSGIFQPQGIYYHSILAVLANSRYRDIEALKGSRLVLTDPVSTSGALLPRKQFAPRIEMPIEKYFGAISFSGSHTKSALALARGEVDAAFISSTKLDETDASSQLPASKIRILWKSEAIPYDPVVYRGQLCESLRKQIRAAFLGEASTMALREVLDGFNAVRFVAISDSHYAGIRKLLQKP